MVDLICASDHVENVILELAILQNTWKIIQQNIENMQALIYSLLNIDNLKLAKSFIVTS